MVKRKLLAFKVKMRRETKAKLALEAQLTNKSYSRISVMICTVLTVLRNQFSETFKNTSLLFFVF